MKILIVKTSALGDIIQAFPVLQYLRHLYPEAQIDWVVEHPFAPLVEAHPCLNSAIRVNTKKWRLEPWKREVWREMLSFRQRIRQTNYDMLFDLQANFKSGLINWCVKCPKKIGFGFSTVSEKPNLLFTNRRYNPPKGKNACEEYLYIAQNALGDFNFEIEGVKLKISDQEKGKVREILEHPHLKGEGPKVMVCAGSNWPNKVVGKETLRAFLTTVADQLQGRFVFVWGTVDEKELAQELSANFSQNSCIADKLALPTLQNLMAELDLVVAMDSLPLHLAATTPTPTYSVFGASAASKYKPLGKRHEAYQGSCPYGRTFERRCPILRTCPTGSCIKDIQGDQLFQHFYPWWKSYNK